MKEQWNRRSSITLTANAGILITGAHHKILIDGLHREKNEFFSTVPADMSALLLDGKAPFEQIDTVIYSHFHKDHFDFHLTKLFIERQSPDRLILPQGLSKEEEYDIRKATEKGACEMMLVQIPYGTCREIPLSAHNKIIVFPIPHAGKQYDDIVNLCVACCLEDEKLLVLADADYNADFLRKMLGDMQFDRVIVNPLFLHLEQGRRVLQEALHTKEILFYHLPFAADDVVGFRDMLEKDMKKYQKEFVEMKIIEGVQ